MGQYQLAYSAAELELMVTSVENIVAPTYNSASTYNVGDTVMYETVLYVCNTANTTGAFDSTKWDETMIFDNDSDLIVDENGLY